jgi:hypothetical protein
MPRRRASSVTMWKATADRLERHRYPVTDRPATSAASPCPAYRRVKLPAGAMRRRVTCLDARLAPYSAGLRRSRSGSGTPPSVQRRPPARRSRRACPAPTVTLSSEAPRFSPSPASSTPLGRSASPHHAAPRALDAVHRSPAPPGLPLCSGLRSAPSSRAIGRGAPRGR